MYKYILNTIVDSEIESVCLTPLLFEANLILIYSITLYIVPKQIFYQQFSQRCIKLCRKASKFHDLMFYF